MFRNILLTFLIVLPVSAQEVDGLFEELSVGLSIPWSEKPEDYRRLGEIKDLGKTFGVVYAGWSPKHFLMRVELADAAHVQAESSSLLAKADSIEVGIDARGDRAEDYHEKGPVGPDDVQLIFGQVDNKAVGRVVEPRNYSGPDVVSTFATIQQQTDGIIYDLRIPWAFLNVKAGIHAQMGLGLQINNLDKGDEKKKTIHWGEGLKDGFRPRQLFTLRFGAPPEYYAVADWTRTTVFDSSETNELAMSFWPRGSHVNIQIGEQTQTIRLTGEAVNDWHRQSVELPAQKHGTVLSATPEGGEKNEVRQVNARELYQLLHDRIDKLAGDADAHPLFRCHLRSLGAQISAEWGRLNLERLEDPSGPLQSVGYFQRLLAGLKRDAGTWNTFLEGRRSLLISYISPHDQTVRHYFLGLPKYWNEEVEFPLFFELPGRGERALALLSRKLGADPDSDEWTEDEKSKVFAEIDRSGFWVQPFCRGNRGYQGIAQIDVLEAYEHVHKLVRIDASRRYLYGFSAGGGGVWNLGMRTPGRWAAAFSFAPEVQGVSSELVPNWSLIPYRILTGALDSKVTHHERILTAFQEARLPAPESVFERDLIHEYSIEKQRDMIEWLKTHTRERPLEFSFVTDSVAPAGNQPDTSQPTNTCWGVSLFRDELTSKLARAAVRIEGNTVTINTEGASEVGLDFSQPDGLGLEGKVKVVLNGQEAYSGKARRRVWKVNAANNRRVSYSR